MNNQLFSKSDLRKLIIPLIIEQTLALTVGMFDAIMVASAGESVMSGVSLVDTIAVLIINLFAALATGGAIAAGQYIGAKDKENVNRAAKQLVNITFLISIVITVLCLLLNRQMLSLFFGKIEADVISSARAYFYITTLSFPFIALFNAAAALFRGMGNSKIPMINALIMNIINLIGNAIFIYGAGWGAFGAGLSTTISRVIAAIVMMVMLRRSALDISVRSYRFWDFNPKIIKRILGIGIPNGFENCTFQIGRIILTGLVAALGTTSIAANGVANSLTGIEVIPGIAIGLALTTVAAPCVGANEYEQAKRYIKQMLKLAYACLIGFNIFMLVILRPLLGLYSLSPETFELAFKIMLIHGFGAMLVWPVSFVLPNAFRAASDVKYPMFISIFSMIVFRIGFSYLFAYAANLGVLSVWFAMTIDWTFRSICFAWRYFSGKWKKTNITQISLDLELTPSDII